MATSILRSIYRQAASCNWAGNSAARSVNLVCRKARSSNFVGSPMCTVSDRYPMCTVSGRISSPWLMLPPSFEGGNTMFNKFYCLADDKVINVRKRSSIGEEEIKLESEKEAVLVGSSHGWLALYKGMYNFDLFLYNPFSHRYIKLPPVETLPFPEPKEKWRGSWGRPEKIILSCSPDDDSCRAIMCFGTVGYMALCHPGRSTEWTPFGALSHQNEELNEFLGEPSIARVYEDFVYSTTQKQLFCVTQYADFEGWDIGDPLSPRLIWEDVDDYMDHDEDNYPWVEDNPLKKSCIQLKYLVFAEQKDRLFLVRRHVMERMGPDGPCIESGLDSGLDQSVPYKTVSFDVHEIDREKGELRYMDGTLDGVALFIGTTSHGFAVESPETMNLEPNSIYFTDPKEYTPPNWDKYPVAYGGHDLGIFNYGNKTFSPCYYPCDIQKVNRIDPPPMWFTPSSSSV